MTRHGREAMVEIWEDRIRRAGESLFLGELRHLVHKSKTLDWTQGVGPGGGNAPSDLARSIVGDVVGYRTPAPVLYRRLTLRLARIPHEGGEVTSDEVCDILEEVLES